MLTQHEETALHRRTARSRNRSRGLSLSELGPRVWCRCGARVDLNTDGMYGVVGEFEPVTGAPHYCEFSVWGVNASNL